MSCRESVVLGGRKRQIQVVLDPAKLRGAGVSAVEVQEGRMQLSCEINDIPPALLDAAQEAVNN